MPKYLDTTYIS